MRKRLIVGIILSGILLVGCGEQKNEGRVVKDNISQEEIERLPEDQKTSELDKILAANRKFKKENTGEKDGSMSAVTMSDSNIPNRVETPEFTAGELENALSEMTRYLKSEKGIEDIEKANIGTCIDPRVNEIYKEEDKGVAKGYENNNIFVGEYEDKDGSYKYLILVREDSQKPWKVIHDGTSYK